jgi:hypothetical protein
MNGTLPERKSKEVFSSTLRCSIIEPESIPHWEEFPLDLMDSKDLI